MGKEGREGEERKKMEGNKKEEWWWDGRGAVAASAGLAKPAL